MAEPVAAGEVLSGRFELLGQVGRGGMGTVWRARDQQTGEIVAVKVLHGFFADNPAYRDRFAREVELARRVSSPRVVRVLGFGSREGVPFLVLEFVEGKTLGDLLRSHGPYTWAETRTLLAAVSRGLADVHAAGVVHRDIKPSNILVTPDGRVKLTDFGIARALDLARLTGTSTMLGTPAYLAPEGQRDERSDLYALGVVAFELLTGAPPFAGDSTQGVLLAHINTPPDLARLPAEARPLVGWLLAKDPGKRPSTAVGLLAALEGTATAPTLALPASPTRRSRRPAIVAAVVGLVVVVALALATLNGIIGDHTTAPSNGPVASSQPVASGVAAASSGPTAIGEPSPTESPSPVASQPESPIPSASAPAPSGQWLTVPAWPATWHGNPYPGAWYARDGSLYNSGTQSADFVPVLVPAASPDYVVTVKIQRFRGGWFGIAVRANDKNGYVVRLVQYSNYGDALISTVDGNDLSRVQYHFDTSIEHTYVVTVEADTITLAVDGAVIVSTHSTRFPDPGGFYLVSDQAELQVGPLSVAAP